MEVEEMPTPGCKFPRIRSGNGRADSSTKVGKKRGDEQYHPEEEGEGEGKVETQRRNLTVTGVVGDGVGGGGGGGLDIATAAGGLGRFCGGWPSSRIVRVSRASGGKDRHSKVWTSKGLRDRRVRLSVNTAIQFYDLQDRLGYDQPSKAVEWLLKAASSSISELPSINTSFPDTSQQQQQQLSDEKRSSTTVGATDQHGFDSAEADMESDQQLYLQYHGAGGGGGNFSKSACSSTSETSKGSGLSLSRSESRIKARERARERAAEKEKEKDHQNPVNPPPISQSSFTELLTGVASNNNTSGSSPNGGNNGGPNESNFFQKSSPRHWSSSTPMDYFATGLLGGPSSSRSANPSTTSFLGQIQLGNQLHQQPLTAVSSPLLFSVTGGGEHHHSELHRFSFVPDHHLVPVVTTANNTPTNGNGNHGGSDYNLNFTMTPSSATSGTFAAAAGFDRGTLQSNSSSSRASLLQFTPQLVRFQNMDRSTGFFTPASTSPQPNATVVEDHHHHHQHQHSFLPGFDAGRLQLYYGGGGHHSDQKEKLKH